METLTRNERNTIYDLLKRVTAVIEHAQARCSQTEDGNSAYDSLTCLIQKCDNLYFDTADTE